MAMELKDNNHNVRRKKLNEKANIINKNYYNENKYMFYYSI